MLEECELRHVNKGNWAELEMHPLCTLFPEMQNDEYEELKGSIKSHGFLSSDPIVLIDIETEGVEVSYQILDGRNRYNAAMDAGQDPVFSVYEGNDPRAFVLARNLNRRHLSAGQKAAIASKLANIKVGGNQFTEGDAVSQKEAAAKLDTSPKAVQRFKRVESNDPALAERVKNGELSLNAAENEIKEDLQESFGTVRPKPAESAEDQTKEVDGGDVPNKAETSISDPEAPVGFNPVVYRLTKAYADNTLSEKEFKVMVIDALTDAINYGKRAK